MHISHSENLSNCILQMCVYGVSRMNVRESEASVNLEFLTNSRQPCQWRNGDALSEAPSNRLSSVYGAWRKVSITSLGRCPRPPSRIFPRRPTGFSRPDRTSREFFGILKIHSERLSEVLSRYVLVEISKREVETFVEGNFYNESTELGRVRVH